MSQCRDEHRCQETRPATWYCVRQKGHRDAHEADYTHEQHTRHEWPKGWRKPAEASSAGQTEEAK